MNAQLLTLCTPLMGISLRANVCLEALGGRGGRKEIKMKKIHQFQLVAGIVLSLLLLGAVAMSIHSATSGATASSRQAVSGQATSIPTSTPCGESSFRDEIPCYDTDLRGDQRAPVNTLVLVAVLVAIFAIIALPFMAA